MSTPAPAVALSGPVRLRERTRGIAATLAGPAIQAQLALTAIVLLSALIVVAAAGRPSFLSAPTRFAYFPAWMAGPFGGLWTGIAFSPALKWLFSGAVLISYASYVLLLRRASAISGRTLGLAIVAVQVVYLLSPPLMLTDVFNYLNYARMETVHHLNPYVTMPVLEPHGDPAYALSNWHGLLSPYGPLFTIFTFAFTPLSLAAYLWSFKAALLVADGLILVLTWLCAGLLGRDTRRAVAFVGLNPIVLIWGLGADHNDFLTIMFLVLAIYLLLLAGGAQNAGRAISSARAERINAAVRSRLSPAMLDGCAGAALVLAAGMKASAALLLVIVLAALAHQRRRFLALLAGAGIAGLFTIAVTLIAFGTHFPDLAIQGSVVSAMSLPNLLGIVLGQGGEGATLHLLVSVALAVGIVACCALAWRRRAALDALGFSTIALIASLSWDLPWYILWVLPLAALSRSKRLRQASILLGLYLILATLPASTQLMSSAGFRPQQTRLGIVHTHAIQELLNP